MPKGRPKKLVIGSTEPVVTIEDTPTVPVVEEVKIVEQKNQQLEKNYYSQRS